MNDLNTTNHVDQMQNAMVDIETLGTKPGSVILSIGAVMFGPSGIGPTFYATVAPQSCVDVGLTIDAGTVAWWMGQSDAARAAAFSRDAAPLRDVLTAFHDWFMAQRAVYCWCQGANFDAPLLDASFNACGLVAPWKFWNVRDTRTLYELAHVKVDRKKGTHHNALDDATAQAEAAVQALQRLVQRAASTARSATRRAESEVRAEEAKLYRDLTGDAVAMGYDGLPAALQALKATRDDASAPQPV